MRSSFKVARVCGSQNGDFSAMPTLIAFVLRGDGGEGVTVQACGRLKAATIQRTSLSPDRRHCFISLAVCRYRVRRRLGNPPSSLRTRRKITSGTFVFPAGPRNRERCGHFRASITVTFAPPRHGPRRGGASLRTDCRGSTDARQQRENHHGRTRQRTRNPLHRLQNNGTIEAQDRRLPDRRCPDLSNSTTGEYRLRRPLTRTRLCSSNLGLATPGSGPTPARLR